MNRKRFPILGEPSLASVPWSLMAAHETRVRDNHGHSLAELADRGGLSPCEALSAIMELDLHGLLTQPHGRGRCGCVEELLTIACSWSVIQRLEEL